MLKAVVLVPLLVLGWAWTLQGHQPVLLQLLQHTQENFDVSRVSSWVLLPHFTAYCLLFDSRAWVFSGSGPVHPPQGDVVKDDSDVFV